jgi:hypothetical protein
MIFVLYFYLKENQYEPKKNCENNYEAALNKTVI